MAKLEYVGCMEEILELDYGILKTIVLLCNWVKTNNNKNCVTIKQGEYGFTLVNFNSLTPILVELFAFLIHVE